jgi:Cu/Zn superoxide dismutase
MHLATLQIVRKFPVNFHNAMQAHHPTIHACHLHDYALMATLFGQEPANTSAEHMYTNNDTHAHAMTRGVQFL